MLQQARRPFIRLPRMVKILLSMLPILAEKLGLDPAVMANPLISTVTDAVSLLIYIFVAKLILNI